MLINGLTAVSLFMVVAIKKTERKLHENLPKSAIASFYSVLGNVAAAYHMTSDSTNCEGVVGYVIILYCLLYIVYRLS
jgi:hypothetical protein